MDYDGGAAGSAGLSGSSAAPGIGRAVQSAGQLLPVTMQDPPSRVRTGLGAGPGKRCLEVGAGGGSVALWLAGGVAPGGTVVATDLETGFLQPEAAGRAGLEVLRHDITAEELPAGFDLVHVAGWWSGCRISGWRFGGCCPRCALVVYS